MATSGISAVLKDVIAYVDVWSSDKTANYSKPFIQQLQEMGAQVSKTFTKQVTHVVFNNGHPATWRKAKKCNVKLVSVLWVGRCYEEAVQVDEQLFPALNDANPVLKNKKHRCMQPKDSPERTPDNDKRMKKKLDKMMKDIAPLDPLVRDVSPIIIDEKNGIVYSPALKRSDYMARRLKDMKEKRENLSPTASQMVESPSGLKPSLGNSPSVFKFPYDQSDDDSSASVAETGYSPAKEEGRTLPDLKDYSHECLKKKQTKRLWMSPPNEVFRKTSISPLKCPKFKENEDEEENGQKGLRRVSRRMTVKRNSTESNKSVDLAEMLDPGTSNSKTYSKKERRTSKLNSPSSASKEHKHSSSKSDRKEREETTKGEKSYTGKKTQVLSKNVKYSATASGPPIETASPLLKKEWTIPKQAPIFSALVRPITLPSHSQKTVSCSTDGDDDVFDDYFSPTNFKQRPKKNSSDLTAKNFELPFVLDSNTKKRKPRRCESAVSETTSNKKKKLEESAKHLKDLDAKDTSDKHSHQDNKQLSGRNSSSAKLTQLTKRRRQSALPFTGICVTTTKHRKLSLSFEPTKAEQTDTALESHKESDTSVPSHTLTSRGNEVTVATGLTEAASEEHSKEGTTSPQTMVNKAKVGRTLVMTSMPTEKQNTVVQVVKALGGFSIVDGVCASTTHVVSGGHRRTLNILLGIARGCWILSFEWILWSLEKRQWIPEEPYELSDQFPAAQICRLQRHLSAGEHQQDLFQDQPAIFVSQHSQPPTQSLIELIQLCGGTVCKTVRQAGICIGKYNGRRPEGSRILSELWVLDSITHLKQLPYDDYMLE